MNHPKLRIRFRKTGDLRWISHRDLARAFERWFRRAGLPLAMSEGFHPHPRINFPSALALGIEGQGEWVEARLEQPVAVEAAREALAGHAPPGLDVLEMWVLDGNHPKPQVARMTYEIDVPRDRIAAVAQAIESLWACPEFWLPREGRPEPLNLRQALADVELIDRRLRFSLAATGQAQARPREVLAALGLDDLEAQGAWLVRTDVHLIGAETDPPSQTHVACHPMRATR